MVKRERWLSQFKKMKSRIKFWNIRFAPPDAEGFRLHGELAWPVVFLIVDDFAVAVGIFEYHAVMALKIEEIAFRRGMATRSEDNFDLPFLKKIE